MKQDEIEESCFAQEEEDEREWQEQEGDVPLNKCSQFKSIVIHSKWEKREDMKYIDRKRRDRKGEREKGQKCK